jgi:signal transduction histidine kinase
MTCLLHSKSLVAHLVLPLVIALAIAQGMIVFVIHDEQKGVVAAMAHGQALDQAATLVRLLARAPESELPQLLSAFASKTSCALLLPGPPPDSERPLDTAELHLTGLLRDMLRDENVGAARISIRPPQVVDRACDPNPTLPGDQTDGSRAWFGKGMLAAEMTVPLVDRRTLIFRTMVETPPSWSWIAIFSFLLSAAAVSAVALILVHHQTRFLRALASSAERAGRGEDVPALPEAGPAEIATTIRAFNTMQERRRRYVSDRLRLLAAISHDLRTPLTTLRLKAEFIDDDTTREGMISTIDELTAITEATLAFTRAEIPREKTSIIDLPELVAEVIAEFELNERAVTFTADGPLAYACRPITLKRAIRNLIDNAIRYGGVARVRFTETAGAPSIRIDDDGPGLPEELIEDAFKPFLRLEPSRSTATGGIGLGLAIARGIVQAHGGSVVLTNRPEGGLGAEISLPAQGPGG